ncbi:MlaD family protein [Maridesulfovibrio hydrothermalis]|uniref:Mammalian cell entry related domain protein n=1 Tax=Maridesulfovibrio hydrothermalis AM13 = DSM 14728 TaxID=1121451 RepID=L0RG46_9BACT|nr:MlaD family protein [Maridesulfovibrio hydrothermalis]CCO25207.1 Mammalian cell entry related domain protein [Maridesulfovibrio hydrothermalis AM13 = DSM 14728]
MSRKTNPFRLGLFIIGGTFLLVIALAILGAGKIFEHSIKMETYLNESVNGLEVGSPIKFRGVKIGSVANIGFVTDHYVTMEESALRYVYVLGDLNHDMFETKEGKEIAQYLTKEVERGLRARPVSLGLTGQLFLEIDYVDPDKNSPLNITWKPENLYIPSAPSMLSRVEGAVASISETLEDINKAKIADAIEDVRAVAQSMDRFLKNSDTGEISKRLTGTLAEAEKFIARINQLLAAPEVDNLMPDVAASARNLRNIMESSSGDIVAALKDLRKTSASARNITGDVEMYMKSPQTKQTMADLSKTLNNISEASDRIKAAAVRFEGTLSRVNMTVAGQQGNVDAILDNVRRLVENLRELSSEAKQYPSGVLFGAPPRKGPAK